MEVDLVFFSSVNRFQLNSVVLPQIASVPSMVVNRKPIVPSTNTAIIMRNLN